MKLLRKKSLWPYFMLTFLAVFSFFAISKQIKTVQAESIKGEHLITFYDRGTTSSILTDAKTLRDAIKEAKINLDQSDIVEPSLDEQLVSSNYDVNIYRARPVTIIDGPTRIRVMTAYQTAKQIADSVGIKLYSEDLTTMSLSSDLASDGAGLNMMITRAKTIKANIYGKDLELKTQAKTVQDFINEKKLTLSDNDRLSINLSSPIYENMTLKIWREGKQTVSADEEIEFGVEEVKDANRYIGYREISSQGKKGLKNVTYEVEVKNGEIISRNQISSVVITDPTKEIIIVGIKYNGPDFRSTETKQLWLTNSGISQLDWGYVDYIISKESNWNPNSVNRSSGACGLAQALPCSKVPGTPLDPIDNLKWANDYATKRYGSWEKAYNFWLVHKWW